jgi:N-acetylmuramoyl-L-alanine amidase/putative methionine-R-sulfoxide reductase with GAF domain
MSANPQNASLGLPDDKSPTEELPGREVATVSELGDDASTGSQLASHHASHALGHEALQALLAFSALHEQIRQRRAREKSGEALDDDVWQLEHFVLDEVLQLVAERALTLTGADGVAIAMAEDNAIVCRAAAGHIVPEPGARLDPKSGFSGACLRTGGIIRCDDSEQDPRVNVQVCRLLGTRSIVAVPIASTHGIIGLVEAFSSEPHGFNDSDVRSLKLLAELILAAMKPEEENRLAEISQRVVAEQALEAPAQSLENQVRTDESSPVASGVENSATVDSRPAPEMFQEYAKEKKFPSRAILLLLIALVAALAAGLWWKFGHSARPKTEAIEPIPTISLPASETLPEPQATPPVPVAVEDQSAAADDKPSQHTMVTGISHVSSADASTVIIEMQGEVQYEAHRLGSPERIYFDLHDTALAPGMFGRTIEIGDARLARVRIAQPVKGVSRVVLETTGASDFSVSMQSNPYRLVVEIRKAGKSSEHSAVADLPTATTVAPQPALIPTPSTRAADKVDGRLRARVPKFRLVLDAGHGGWDLGTVGRKGLMEKDLVLDIVHRLGKLVQSRLSAEVLYTRQDDTYLPLEKRTEIANLAQADLFVSVHANYSNDSSARGAETYYTNTYSSLKARTSEADAAGAAAENVNWNNVDIREKVLKSRRFAVAVQQSLYRMLATQIPDMRNRGVKKATYVVLTGTSMPAILAEVSFVSSPEDETKLKNSNYRQKIAEGLYKGIAEYVASSRSVNVASASSKPSGF